VIVLRNDRQVAQYRIPVSSAAQPSIFTNPKIESKLISNCVQMVLLARGFIHARHFLQRNDVSIDLLQHLGNALGPNAAIHTHTLVDVISCDAKR
jgi:hypothetical protein